VSRALAVCHGEFGRATVYELDRPLVTHAHREGHLIFQFGGPPGLVTVRGRTTPIHPDSVITINPWEPHAFTPAVPGAAGKVFVMYIRPRWLQEIMRAETGSTVLFPGATCRVTPLLGRMLRAVLGVMDDPPRDGSLDRMLAEICVLCAEEAGWHEGKQRPTLTLDWNGLDFRVRRSVTALSNPNSPSKTMGSLALSCGLSRAHFFKLFSEQTGVTPVVFANTIRIEESLRRIAMPNAAITDIGDELGFSCQSAFTRFFAAHIGMPPTAYRSAIRMVCDAHAA
jgi:AraC-like DNA-binding protein